MMPVALLPAAWLTIASCATNCNLKWFLTKTAKAETAARPGGREI